MQEEQSTKKTNQRNMSASKHLQGGTQSSSKRDQLLTAVENLSLNHSLQRLAGLENSTTYQSIKDANPNATAKNVAASGKPNKSKNGALPPTSATTSNSLLNATLMAMISSNKSGKATPNHQTSSKQKSQHQQQMAYSMAKKSANLSSGKPVLFKSNGGGRTKSANKGKAELFNSTAPIKFFSNLEDTVRELGSSLQGAKMPSTVTKKNPQHQQNQSHQQSSLTNTRRGFSSNNHLAYGNLTSNSGAGVTVSQERKQAVYRGTQVITVPKIQLNRPPSQSSVHGRRKGGQAESNVNDSKLSATAIGHPLTYPAAQLINESNNSFNQTTPNLNIQQSIIDAQPSAAAAQHETSSFVNTSVIACFQGDYSLPPQTNNAKSHKGRQSSTSVSKTKTTNNLASGYHHTQQPAGTSSNNVQQQSSLNNSRIKLRLNQQKTRSSSSFAKHHHNGNGGGMANSQTSKKGGGTAIAEQNRFTSTQHYSDITANDSHKTMTQTSGQNRKRNQTQNSQQHAHEQTQSNSSGIHQVNQSIKSGGIQVPLQTLKMASSKSRQNATSTLSGALKSELKSTQNGQNTTVNNNNNNQSSALQSAATSTTGKLVEKEFIAKVNKSFSGAATTAASKKQRQTLKGVIEGLNQTGQTSSVAGSSSKRQSSQHQYQGSAMNMVKKQRGSSNHQSNHQPPHQEASMTGKAKDATKMYTSYNYHSSGVGGQQQNQNSSVAASAVSGPGQKNNTHHQTGSKSSLSLTHLTKNKKGNLNNSSLICMNSTSKQLGMGSSATENGNVLPQFARVDFDRLNSRSKVTAAKNAALVDSEASACKKYDRQQAGQPTIDLTMDSYQDIKKYKGGGIGDHTNPLNQSQRGLSDSTQKAFLSASNRLNMPKHSTTKSIENSSSYFATCTASGPLNPFLEQILKEIPKAYSGNATAMNSAQATTVLNLGSLGNTTKDQQQLAQYTNFNVYEKQSSKANASNGSKKTLGKISKKIRSNMNIGSLRKEQISNTFNLTTTAAALLAASDKNAAACLNIETKTFETRNSNSVSGIPATKASSGMEKNHQSMLNSSKKQNLNKTMEGGKSSALERKLAQNQRASSNSRGQFRLNSQKQRSSKSSYSQSLKRQPSKQSRGQDSSAIYISEAIVTKDDYSKPTEYSSKPSLSQSRLTHSNLQGQDQQHHSAAVATQQQKLGSLMNVVKVAAKQKSGLNQKQLNLRSSNKQKYSLNTTQVLEDQLLQMKLTGSNKNTSQVIPQKQKVQSKSKFQLNSSTGNILKANSNPATTQAAQNNRTTISKKRSPTPQEMAAAQAQMTSSKEITSQPSVTGTVASQTTTKNVVPSSQPKQHHNHYSNEATSKPTLRQVKKSSQHQVELAIKHPQQQQQHQRRETRGKTNEPQSRKSNQLKFDWSGFLSNLMHENFQPKKSTSGPGNTHGSALCEKPYQLQQDMQNKTQPLPKGLLQNQEPQHDAYDLQNKGAKNRLKAATNTAYGAPHLPKTESRNSEYRPRIGRKQIEIAPISGAQTNFAATMNHNQLKKETTAALQAITVLTDVTERGETEKEPSESELSTHRTPGKVDQDYKFGRLLGEGAYAVVRLAYKKSEGKNYAAKIYDKSKLVDEHRRNSVCREVMLMQKLKGPYVVEFSEAFETDNHVYLIIEYVSGKSLHDYLKKQRASPTNKTEFDQTLAEDEVKRLIRQLLQCLEYLHAQGITHRDIKLENILLDHNRDIKIIDFGFSTNYVPQRKLKMFCGTPSYMAPEIVSRVEYYGPPADIWATGVLCFCLLNGFFPFKGQTDAELYRRINRGAFKMVRSDLSDDCLNILKECFNVNPDSRLTASELLQENWFLSDSSKKRSIVEIRQEFKAKILKKFPVRSLNKNTICIPAPPQMNNLMTSAEPERCPTSYQEEERKQTRDTQMNRQLNTMVKQSLSNQGQDLLAQQKNSLAIYRNVNQASPPSIAPESQGGNRPTETATTMHGFQDNIEVIHLQHSRSSDNSNDDELRSSGVNHTTTDDAINQEALLAYYNTSQVQQMQPQANGPPSGGYSLATTTTTPYAAYNQWQVHGSPPSMTDVMGVNSQTSVVAMNNGNSLQSAHNPSSSAGPQQTSLNTQSSQVPQSEYHPMPSLYGRYQQHQQPQFQEMDEAAMFLDGDSAVDVEIIIQGKPPIVKSEKSASQGGNHAYKKSAGAAADFSEYKDLQ